jgi:hypothetical protein
VESKTKKNPEKTWKLLIQSMNWSSKSTLQAKKSTHKVGLQTKIEKYQKFGHWS